MTSNKERTWYFTFGTGHKHQGCYTKIFGTYTSARTEMVRRHKSLWAFQYSSAEEAGVNQFNLKEI